MHLYSCKCSAISSATEQDLKDKDVKPKLWYELLYTIGAVPVGYFHVGPRLFLLCLPSPSRSLCIAQLKFLLTRDMNLLPTPVIN